jgi:hypothetical protein
MLNNVIVQDICRFLSVYNAAGLVLKTNLFAGELKRGVNGVFAVAAPSEEPDKETGIMYQTIDFWARNDDTGAAFAHLTEIYNFFDRRHHYTTDKNYIHFSHCLSQIEDMDRDIENAKLLKLTVRFILNPTNAIS